MLELYKNIKKYRKMMGLSQEELAKRAGYTDRSSIAKIEKGLVDLPQSKITQFADIFGMSAGDLMGNDGVIIEIDPDPHRNLYDLVINLFQMLNESDQDEILTLMRYKLSKYE